MKRCYLAPLLFLVVALAAFSGCDDTRPVISGTPTPSASPTPLPPAYAPVLTAVPAATDALGHTISSSDHYFYTYISFGDLRVYEYETGTFLDGVCVNAYTLPLDGALNIVFYTPEGKVCGIGAVHNGQGSTRLETGSNAIYAEIYTDIDVCEMDFVWEIIRDFLPVENGSRS